MLRRSCVVWFGDCGILVCLQLACPSKAIQAWQAAGIPVALVDTDEKLEEKLADKSKDMEKLEEKDKKMEEP